MRQDSYPSPPRARNPLALLVAGAVVLAALTWALFDVPAPTPTARSSAPPFDAPATEPPATEPAPKTPAAAAIGNTLAERHWRRVLHRLDERRSRAFAIDHPRLLRRVYTGGSTELAEDRATLAAYRQRGLRLSGAHLHNSDLTVVSVSPSRARLDVTDRLGAVCVTGPASRRMRLPHDRPSRHRIVLVRTAAGWRIADVRSADA